MATGTLTLSNTSYAPDQYTNVYKFDNGMMIQTGKVGANMSANAASEMQVTFSEQFYSEPRIFLANAWNYHYATIIQTSAYDVTTSGFVYTAYNTNSAALTYYGNWVAIGRWRSENHIASDAEVGAVKEIKSGITNVTIPANASSNTAVTFSSPFPSGVSYLVHVSQTGQYAYVGLVFGSSNGTASGFTITASSSRTSAITVSVAWSAIPY